MDFANRADSRSFARSSTTRNPRLEVNRMKSRIKYSPLSVFWARRKGTQEERETEGGWQQEEKKKVEAEKEEEEEWKKRTS